jgi:D-alanine--poly(phosphoribitol) ligase subunit 2
MADAGRSMIDYIGRELLRRSDTQLDETTPLVSSGLIDSLMLVDVLLKLEELTNLRIPAGKVQAKDMDTVELMLATARRVGKPRA